MQTHSIPTKTQHQRLFGICSPSYIRFKSRCKPHPVIRLSGQWLQDNGFKIGHVVNIICEKGRLTITIAREQSYEQLQALFEKERIELV